MLQWTTEKNMGQPALQPLDGLPCADSSTRCLSMQAPAHTSVCRVVLLVGGERAGIKPRRDAFELKSRMACHFHCLGPSQCVHDAEP